MKKNLKNICIIVFAIISVISLNLIMSKELVLSQSLNTNNVFLIVEFIISLNLLKKVFEIKEKRLVIISFIISVIFAIWHTVGASINSYKSLDGILFSNNTLIKFSIKMFGEMIWFYIAIILSYQFINKKCDNIENKLVKDIKENSKWRSKKTTFFAINGIILLCWLPYFLTYYPGLTTADSMNQIFQAVGINDLSGHHPLIHTGLIAIGVNIGKVISSYNLGIAIYTVIQMIIMSSIFSYTIFYMLKKNISLKIAIICLVFYAVYPINPLFSLMMWKDIIFAGLMLLFIVNTHNFINKEQIKMFSLNTVLYVLNIILLILFRNNGLYVIVLTIPFVLIFRNKNSKKLVGILASSLIIYFIVNTTIFNILNATKGEVREALSIPMQQFARVVKYHKDELTEEEKEQIYKFIPTDNIEELYNPVLSDPIKSHFDSKAFSENKIEFMQLWIKLVIKYPRACIESFLCNSYGYWYPEAQNWVANRDVEKNNIGIYQDSKIEGKIVRKIDAQIEKRNTSIFSMLFSIGFTFWMIIFCMGYCVYRKKYNILLLYMPIIILWLTTVASPVFCEFRYVYSFVTSLPMYMFTVLENKNNNE